MEFARVKPGDKLKISAAAWNACLDAADSAKKRRGSGSTASPFPEVRPEATVLVKNSSGADRARFEVLGLGDAIFAPATALDGFLQVPTLNGVIPSAASTFGKFCILLEPIKSGAIGLAAVGGISYAKVDVSQTWHYAADVTDGSATALSTNVQGAASILWRETGTGVKWAIVRLGDVTEPIVDCVAPTGGLAYGGSANCFVWRAGAATTWSINVKFKHVGGGQAISAGKNFRASWVRDANEWRVLTADCEA